MSAIVVDIYISPEEYLKWYDGSAENVYTLSHDGRSVIFPAKILQKFVTREGIKGTFLITFDNNNRFKNIEKISPEFDL